MVFTDVLPAAEGAKPAAVRWTPGRTAGTGTLTIQTPARKCSCEYRVTEYPTDWAGRAARFDKADGEAGSDAGADSYDVFVSRNGQDRRCDCKGFERWGHCKHVDALRCLIGNGWLDLHLSNPDADVGETEPPADQPEPTLPELPDPEDFIDPADDAAAEEWLTAPRPDVEPIDWTDIPL